jgi:hypothetical protein
MAGPRSITSPLRLSLPALLLALAAPGCSVDVSIGADAARDPSAVDAGDVVVGDCFDDPYGETDEWVEVDGVLLVPCDGPHDLEAFHRFELPDGEFPSDEAMDRAVDEECIPAFEGFVGRPYEDSELDLAFLTPSADSWADGDREVLCSLYAMDLSQLEGSMEGSGR